MLYIHCSFFLFILLGNEGKPDIRKKAIYPYFPDFSSVMELKTGIHYCKKCPEVCKVVDMDFLDCLHFFSDLYIAMWARRVC